jgi:propionate CoA-transferase
MRAITPAEAASLISDGQAVACAGLVGAGYAEALTAGGLQVRTGDGQHRIVREGRACRLASKLQHLSFNGPYVASLGHRVLYVTERAVFEQRAQRLTRTEIAPGIDLHRNVLAVCGAPAAVADDLRPMDGRIFRDAPMRGQSGP